MIRIEVANVEEVARKLSKVMYMFPEEVNKFMADEVDAMKESIHKEEDPRWQEKITHSKYVKKWQPFNKARYAKSSEKDGIKSWWIINNKMFYERFVNDGHEVRRVKRGPSIGHTKPTHHIDNGITKYEPKFFNNMDKFVEGLMR